MKIGIHEIGIGPYADRDVYRAFAENSDRLGFGTIWNLDHLLMLEKVESKYPYGDLPDDLTFPIINPFIGLSYAASITENIRLATGVCLIPQYNPLILAKLIGTLDYLSNGRFVFGIGIAWLKEAFTALGVPWERRADRTREYVAALRAVWGDSPNDFHGEFADFEGVLSYPKPINGAKLPIFMGGNSEAALRRAAEYSDGWFGLKLTPDEAAEKIGRINELRVEYGRSDEPFEFAVSPPADTGGSPDDLPKYAALGISEVILHMTHYKGVMEADKIPGLLEELAAEWVEPAGALEAASVAS